MQETLLQLTLKTIFFYNKKKRKKVYGLVTEIKKGRLGTSRTTAILKQKGNKAKAISAKLLELNLKNKLE